MTATPVPADGSGAMFDAIAERYDLLNRVLSLGTDRRWRREAIDALALGDRPRVCDVAAGTGDMALAVFDVRPEAHLTAVDPSRGMLEVARGKFERRGLASRVELVVGEAETLPGEADAFDALTIAFGIRNVKDRMVALREMARVTRPAGRIAILELTEPRSGVGARLARVHMHHLVPMLGALLSKGDAYRYLPSSIAAFPTPDEFEGMMREAGIEPLARRPLMFGVAHVFVGQPRGSD